MPRYRRAAHLVSYWQDDRLVLHNYASGLRAAVTPLTIEILEHCTTWRTTRAIMRVVGVPDGLPIDTILAVLVEATFLERSDRPLSASARAFAAWNGWNPAAGFFHASTKNVAYAALNVADDVLRAKAIDEPPPAMLKSGGKGPRVELPPAASLPGLTEPLVNRRTWRRFGTGRVSRADLATLLHLTWGVQHWMQVEGFGRMPLKTSPSGGARHSIEAYALVRRVAGVRPGLYHYGPDDHRLARLDRPRRKVSEYLPTQTWYDDAAVVVFMTAVFARVQWRYGAARAYRGILAEAGHLAQTFCLIATRLGLAPFCSMALADTVIEQDLGIDGVSESVVYAAGVGIQPDGVTWAPWPDTAAVPARTSPAWARGGSRARGRRARQR
jgi:SagB-type dehydrogenase family enzyme